MIDGRARISLIVGAVAVALATAPAHDLFNVDETPSPAAPGDIALATQLTGIDSLASALDRLAIAAAHWRGGDRTDVRRAFEYARARYKRIETLAEATQPGTALAINGPPVVEIEAGAPSTPVLPEGFQVVEPYVYGATSADDTLALRREIAILRANVRRLRALTAVVPLDAVAAFDAARQEIARITLLGLTNFDAILSNRAVPEARAALAGVRITLAPFIYNDPTRARLDSAFVAADASLEAAERAGPLDHLRFTAHEARTLAQVVARTRDALGVRLPRERHVWRAASAWPWDRDAFDVEAYAAPGDRAAHLPAGVREARAALGAQLFSSRVLSGNGRRSCATCHQPTRAFTDGIARSAAVNDGQVSRNAPTLINAALQPAYFYDLRTAFLEDQVADVVANPREMHGDLHVAARTFTSDSNTRALARAAFPGDAVIVPRQLQVAIAAYLRTLIALDDPLDRAMRGDDAALTPSERHGYAVFVGKGKCATCHFLPLLGGSRPPAFDVVDAEVIGVPADKAGRRLDPDLGRYVVTRAEVHRRAFRTPSLRGVALTAPYMHNGVFQSLEEVVDFYNAGGNRTKSPNTTLPPDSLQLSRAERRDLVAFMSSVRAGGPKIR